MDGTGTIGWNYNIDDSALDFLGKNDVVTLTYTVQVDDGNGGTTTQDVVITVQGTEDTPVITSSAQAATITEDGGTVGHGGESGPESASGTITFTDVDLSDIETSSITKTTVSAVLANGYTLTTARAGRAGQRVHDRAATHSSVDGTGTIGWHYNIDNSALDFLGKNDVVTLTYTVQVDDGNGGTTTQDVVITVQGTEDTPVITSSAQAATITEDGGTVGHGGESGPESASGTITFTDVDLSDIETSSITKTTVSAVLANGYTLTTARAGRTGQRVHDRAATHSSVDGTGTIGWHYNIDNSALDFLGKNDVVTLTYTVQVDDGNGGTTTQDVVITVQGTEDTPVITSSAQAATITEDGGTVGHGGESGPESASGTITFTDVDLSDIETSSITKTTVSAVLANGYTLTTARAGRIGQRVHDRAATHSSVDGTGTIGWNYNIDNSALDFLGKNDVVTLTYTVQVDDGNGGTTTQDVVITVQGTEDTPVITSSAQAATITEDGGTVGHGGESGPESASGTITFTDVDLSDIETSSITKTTVSAVLANGYTLTTARAGRAGQRLHDRAATHSSVDGTGTIGWHYNIDDSALDFLGKNDVVTLTYTVQVDDGNGGTTTQDVVITVQGTEDTPVITSSAQAATITEDGGTVGHGGESGPESASGTITFTDVDLSDIETSSITKTTVSAVLANGYTLTTARAGCAGQRVHDRRGDAFERGRDRDDRLALQHRRQRARLPGQERRGDADLYGAGRRRQRRDDDAGRCDHGAGHRGHACDHVIGAGGDDHRGRRDGWPWRGERAGERVGHHHLHGRRPVGH